MESFDLESKWNNIASSQSKKGYRALRITSVSVHDLFIAIDDDGLRCLLFYLPEGFVVNLKETNKNKLLISYLQSKSILLVRLKDLDFKDLFDDLIISIYNKIKEISDTGMASKEFIDTFYKWSLFFEDIQVKKLSEEQLQGLFGELFVLNEYLINSTPNSINSVLDSWKGLYDAVNDFVFEWKNVEVKTKLDSKPFVKIASEYQLESQIGKSLELLVVYLKIDLVEGKSVYDLLLEIVQTIRVEEGDLSILYNALNQKGLTIENLKQYDNHRFNVSKTELFNASHSDFPKLVRSNIADDVHDIKYRLRVTQLNDFLIQSNKY